MIIFLLLSSYYPYNIIHHYHISSLLLQPLEHLHQYLLPLLHTLLQRIYRPMPIIQNSMSYLNLTQHLIILMLPLMIFINISLNNHRTSPPNLIQQFLTIPISSKTSTFKFPPNHPLTLNLSITNKISRPN